MVSRRMPDETIDWINTQKMPLVFICSTNDSDIPSVGVDVNDVVIMQFDHLAGLGHTQITYVGYDGSPLNKLRKSKLTELTKARNISLRLMDAKAPTLSGGQDVAMEAIKGSGKRAIICYNDLVAIAIINAAAEANVKIPEELSIIGVDNIPICDFVVPRLTTVDTDGFGQGKESAQKLLNIINGKPVEKETQITPKLVLGSST